MSLSDQNSIKTVDILGIPVAVTSFEGVATTISRWLRQDKSHYICAADVHSIMCAQDREDHRKALIEADMVTPDGNPLVWTGKLKGSRDMKRVCGPDLLPYMCKISVEKGWKHYFYGGAEGVAEKLAENMQADYPGLQIAGAECPPYRELSNIEIEEALNRMDEAGADIVWIGLGCPKQEIWMLNHAPKTGSKVFVGVGAAFDFHTGRIQRAPLWMQKSGLEWLHRLKSEPKRLWYRYLVVAPKFVSSVAWGFVKQK